MKLSHVKPLVLGHWGYKEEGTITTAFDIRVQNDLDRFHLVEDVMGRLSRLGSQGAYLKDHLDDDGVSRPAGNERELAITQRARLTTVANRSTRRQALMAGDR
jgi:hypothetical protein